MLRTTADALLVRFHVLLRAFVVRFDPCRVLGFERAEVHGDRVALLPADMPAEVGESLAIFLRHVVAVHLVDVGDGTQPGVHTNILAARPADRIPDFIMVVDGAFRLILRRLLLELVLLQREQKYSSSGFA